MTHLELNPKYKGAWRLHVRTRYPCFVIQPAAIQQLGYVHNPLFTVKETPKLWSFLCFAHAPIPAEEVYDPSCPHAWHGGHSLGVRGGGRIMRFLHSCSMASLFKSLPSSAPELSSSIFSVSFSSRCLFPVLGTRKSMLTELMRACFFITFAISVCKHARRRHKYALYSFIFIAYLRLLFILLV